ncbi:MAG: HAD family phosphatase [Acidobacteriota bacterium]|nr:HAD family phosphatase [Acidobacteriota bacterium]
MTPVKAVLFDYGMVLTGPPDPAAWDRMRSITGLSEDRFHHGYWAHRHAYDRGDLNAESFWNKSVSGETGVLLTPDQLAGLIAADVDYWSTLNPSMLTWVQHLQQSKIPTGILSNMPDAMEVGLRARHAWIEDFQHHTWSHAVNLAKPEAAIYLHAAEGMGTPAENILFIDDKQENIDAALAAGMQAIQYTSHDSFEREMHARGLGYLL